MSVNIRAIVADEFDVFLRCIGGPFAFDLPDDEKERADTLERFSKTFEVDRSRCAFDGDQMVGTLGAYTHQMTVPGGSVSCAGTTMVTVLASHRRQGILRKMMTEHFAEARERQDPIAALWATDSGIYGRFGYGLATVSTNYELDRAHVAFHRLAPEPDAARFVDAAAAAKILPPIHAAILPTRPGMFARTKVWWDTERLADRPEDRGGATTYRFVVSYDGDGNPSGYVQYRIKEGWEHHHGAHEVRIVEMMGLTASAYAGLLKVVLAHDLANKITASRRPVDDPIFDLLASGRRAAPEITDAMWVRILDVPAALTARRYDTAGTAVIRTNDPMNGETRTWILETDGMESNCRRTDADPDIELDIEDLGSAYMGRSRFGELVRAGRAVGDHKAARNLDRMFTWDPQPWCPEVF